MKRTEKIEVRVSQEEKETLTTLAKQEGDSVSGLVRGLIDKYMALNTASTKRRLPKWQLAALLIGATLIGHIVTLIPMHVYSTNYFADKALPEYVVHGIIGDDAFGVDLSQSSRLQKIRIETSKDEWLTILFYLNNLDERGGRIQINMCKNVGLSETCNDVYSNLIIVERVSPHVISAETSTDQSFHLFIQELA